MKTGNISSVETMALVDGPGVRFVVFMQGCNLRCTYCHNPETWLINTGTSYTTTQLVNYILKYQDYFKNSNGGVTFSGGEPLLQSDFLLDVCKELKKHDIHTCLDTSGTGFNNNELLDYIDLVLFDIKALKEDTYKNLTGAKINESLKFLDLCQQKKIPLWIRQVIIPGINDNKDYIKDLTKFLKPLKYIENIEILPYHNKAIEKYQKLNIPYRLKDIPNMNEEYCKNIENKLKKDLGIN